MADRVLGTSGPVQAGGALRSARADCNRRAPAGAQVRRGSVAGRGVLAAGGARCAPVTGRPADRSAGSAPGARAQSDGPAPGARAQSSGPAPGARARSAGPDPGARAGGIQVISRAGQILRALAGEREGLSLSQLALRVGLPRSTVHRIVAALESEGLAASASPSGRYRLGIELVRLARSQHGDLRAQVHPLLQRLSREVNETVDLSILIGDRASFIDQIAAPHRLRAVSAIGASFPAHGTANGKALLAAQVESLLPERLEALTPNTITSRGRLIQELGAVRRLGYAVDHEEHTLGISAIGAVVCDPLGAVAAISIPVPTQRFEGNEAALVRALRRTCAEASLQLGAAAVDDDGDRGGAV